VYARAKGIPIRRSRNAGRRPKADSVLTLKDLAGDDPVMLRNMRNAQRSRVVGLLQLARHVRELRNTIRTALAICEDNVIRLSDLPPQIGQPGRIPLTRN